MKTKKIITWKDADQNLCTLAAYILHQAMVELRSSQSTTVEYPIDDGTRTAVDMGSDTPRTVFSCVQAMLTEDDYGVPFPENDGDTPSAQCWWCFQNLIRMKLAEARKELKRNLYGTGSESKVNKQSSRNYTFRTSRSKYGRQAERQ